MKNKKFLAMILALTMVVAIAGCGAKTDKNETDAKENSTKVESSVLLYYMHDVLICQQEI